MPCAIVRDIRRHSSDSWRHVCDRSSKETTFYYKDGEDNWAFRLKEVDDLNMIQIAFKHGLFDESDFMEDDGLPRRLDADGRVMRVLRVGATTTLIKVEEGGGNCCFHEVPAGSYHLYGWMRERVHALLVFAQGRLVARACAGRI